MLWFPYLVLSQSPGQLLPAVTFEMDFSTYFQYQSKNPNIFKDTMAAQSDWWQGSMTALSGQHLLPSHRVSAF